ncbi:hypothetical protein TGMAS_237840B, partial [Toxoplasma gondii MAS]
LLHRLPLRLLDCVGTMSPEDLCHLLPAASVVFFYCAKRGSSLFPSEEGKSKRAKRENFMTKTASMAYPLCSTSPRRVDLPVSSLEERTERQCRATADRTTQKDKRRARREETSAADGQGKKEAWTEVSRLWFKVVEATKRQKETLHF